jgi:hypothetical protein
VAGGIEHEVIWNDPNYWKKREKNYGTELLELPPSFEIWQRRQRVLKSMFGLYLMVFSFRTW